MCIKPIIYLNSDIINFLNKKALQIWKVKKGDKHELASHSKLNKVIEIKQWLKHGKIKEYPKYGI